MPKQRPPALADWHVAIVNGDTRTVRATSLHIRDGAAVLSDTYGHPLFAAPLGAVLCVRRLEPGEEVPAPLHAAERLGAADLVTHMAEAHNQHFTVGFSHAEIIRAHIAAHGTAPEPGAATEKPVPEVPAPRRSAKRGGK
jgi:hypothetical protein